MKLCKGTMNASHEVRLIADKAGIVAYCCGHMGEDGSCEWLGKLRTKRYAIQTAHIAQTDNSLKGPTVQSEKMDGGPAFPVIHDVPPTDEMTRAISVESGMSLRAYVATACLQGILTAADYDEPTAARAATIAVEHADALLAELSKP